MYIQSKRPFIYAPNDDSGAGSGGENHVIRSLREQAEKAQKDLAEAKTQISTFQNELETLKKEKMGDLERLTHERDTYATQIKELSEKANSIEPLAKQVEAYKGTISEIYEKRLTTVPKEVLEHVKGLTLIEGNPVESLKKLDLFLSIPMTKAGTVTNPTGGSPGVSDSTTKKLDPKTISWSEVFKPINNES